MVARLRAAGGLAAVAVMALGAAGAAAEEAPDPACVSRPDCRFVGAITLRTDQGVKTPALNRNMPFLRQIGGHQRLWLVLGERVDLRVGGPGEPPLTVVAHGQASDPRRPDGTLKDMVEVEFAQMDGSTFTNLTVRNGYARPLLYKAYLLSKSGDERHTSTCPVLPGVFSMENWQGPMVEIDLADFQLTDPAGTTITCQ